MTDITDEELDAIESHDAIESPGWETKIVCSCGERCASKFEFAQHQAAGRGVQLGALVAALRSAWEENAALRDGAPIPTVLSVVCAACGESVAQPLARESELRAELERERTQNRELREAVEVMRRARLLGYPSRVLVAADKVLRIARAALSSQEAPKA